MALRKGETSLIVLNPVASFGAVLLVIQPEFIFSHSEHLELTNLQMKYRSLGFFMMGLCFTCGAISGKSLVCNDPPRSKGW